MLKRVLLLLASCCTVAAVAVGETSEARFSDPVYRFSVEIPSLGDPAGAPTVTRLLVSGPMIDGFATNCNVQVQYPRMSHPEFVELSMQQFASVGFAVVEHEPTTVSDLPATIFEYRGSMGGRELHFVAVAASDGERVVMLTCTTLEQRFEAEREALMRALTSFTVEPSGTSSGGDA